MTTLNRVQLFAPDRDAEAIAAVIAAVLEAEPSVRRLTQESGRETVRHDFVSGGVAIEVTADDRVHVPALLEFRVADTAALTAAVDRVRETGYEVEPWPESDPMQAVVRVGGVEIVVQRESPR